MKKNRYPYRNKANNSDQKNLATLITQNAQSTEAGTEHQENKNKPVNPRPQHNPQQNKAREHNGQSRPQSKEQQTYNKPQNGNRNNGYQQNRPKPRTNEFQAGKEAGGYRNDHRNNKNDHRMNRNRPRAIETIEDIRVDIGRIEKEIELEISEIRSLKLGL